MGRLTTSKTEYNREMICRYEDCDVCEEYCPHLQEDNCHCLKEVIEKLGQYEDAEEQGLLLRLPCKVGDTIYKIPSETNYRLNIVNGYTENNRVYKQPVYSVQMWSNGRFVVNTCEGLDSVLSDSFGKTWFLTEEEAEQALKQMGE